MITFDYETRGFINLKQSGAWRYSIDPRTQVLCFSWLFDDEPDLGHWHRHTTGQGEWDPVEESPFPEELVRRIEDGEPIEAHNAQFERFVTMNCMRREFPWFPLPRDDQWECSAAKAAMFTLPRALEHAVEALDLPHKKDMLGGAVMKKLMKPAKATKANPGRVWYEDPAELKIVWEYNGDDALAERGLSRSLRDLSPRERRIWQMDAEMNLRGVRADREFLEAALSVAETVKDRMNAEVNEITDGAIPKGTDRKRIKTWLAGRGLVLEDTTGATVDAALGDPTMDDAEALRVLRICREVNRTSTAKYEKMLSFMDPEDDRIRGTMLFAGAKRTRRWAGSGPQFHNFPRGSIKDIEAVAEDVKRVDADWLEVAYGDPMDILSQAARGSLIAGEGKDFFVADYSAIEARDVFWLNGDERGLEDFRASDSGEGPEIYCIMAEKIFGKEVVKKDHPVERFVGKQSILGCGFGMGFEKFLDTCKKYGQVLPDELGKRAVETYREEHEPVVKGWAIQEQAACAAVRSPGLVVEAGRVKWAVRGQFLHCRLPSGDMLSYLRPMIVTMLQVRVPVVKPERKSYLNFNLPAKFGEGQAIRTAYRRAELACKAMGWVIDSDRRCHVKETLNLTYLGTDKNGRLFREETYGGKLMENITQATARDQMADAMVRIDDFHIYDVLLSVHDEAIAEADRERGDLREFEGIMEAPSEWCLDCPIAVEGWRGPRYRKA